MAQYVFDTTPDRSKQMSKIRSRNTKPEIQLRKALWNNGIRYRLYSSRITGKPDIIISKFKILIFVDGEFWHGFQWEAKKLKIKSNRGYWISKIERNIQRDKEVNEHLENAGWTVLRFWSNEIKKNLDEVVSTIERHIALKKATVVKIYPDDAPIQLAAEPQRPQ